MIALPVLTSLHTPGRCLLLLIVACCLDVAASPRPGRAEPLVLASSAGRLGQICGGEVLKL